ncbi:MAG TPA: SAM-dependent methyltransferase [Candidatus Limnocylindria bacterium]|nr:SAM-dependent methyltransferase [Candidatus Limnocylindria bacterium]
MNPLSQQLREQIQRHGPLPFAEFMAQALYHPTRGYYHRTLEQIGKRGDFFTSVSVGSFFGELLAFQFARWTEAGPVPGALFQIVEAGAHDGQLARDILDAIEDQEPTMFASLEYWIIEPSATRQAAQQSTLARFHNVRWWESLTEIKERVHGVIFSNELLDAMPVHPFAWNAAQRRWEEMGVTWNGDAFAWTRLERPTVPSPTFPDALLDVLPNDYIVEVSSAAQQWWRDATAALVQGRLLAIDYGGSLEELLSPSRTSGTLRAYSQHQVSSDVLADPGGQDITAHVNFFEIQRAGEMAGLKTDAFTTQEQFLTEIARGLWTRRGSWPQNQVRQFQTLTHLEHLGRVFRVLIQSR